MGEGSEEESIIGRCNGGKLKRLSVADTGEHVLGRGWTRTARDGLAEKWDWRKRHMAPGGGSRCGAIELRSGPCGKTPGGWIADCASMAGKARRTSHPDALPVRADARPSGPMGAYGLDPDKEVDGVATAQRIMLHHGGNTDRTSGHLVQLSVPGVLSQSHRSRRSPGIDMSSAVGACV